MHLLLVLLVAIMPVRDVNGVRAALNVAAGMGRSGDTELGHLTPGEMVIPRELVDATPNVLPPIIKAFQEHGIDWRRYMVGEKNSKNPSTGQPEFALAGHLGGAGRDAARAMRDARGGGDQDRNRTGFEGSPEMGGRGTVPTYGYNQGAPASVPDRAEAPWYKSLQSLAPLSVVPGVGPIAAALAGLGHLAGGAATLKDKFGAPDSGVVGGLSPRDVLEGRTASPVTEPPPPQKFKPRPTPGAPIGLFSSVLDPLQQRTAIATGALNTADPKWRSQAAQDYYNALASEAVYGGGTESLTPIEKQYLQQVYGWEIPSDANELIRLLGGMADDSQSGALPGSGNPNRGANTASLAGL